MSESHPGTDVRLIQGVVRFVRRRWRRLLLSLAAAALLAIGLSGIYTVPAARTGALFFLGELVRDDLQPGIHYRLPPPLHRLHIDNTSAVRRMRLHDSEEGLVSMVTGDDNIIELDVALQYTISDYGRYLLRSEEWEQVLRSVVTSVLGELMATVTVEQVLTTGKGALQTRARQEAQELLDRYGSGLTLLSVSLVATRPPREALESFRRVADARSEMGKQISDAKAVRSRRLASARGEASSLLRKADSQANEQISRARGDAQRFRDILREYRQAKAITRDDLYRRSMSKVISKARLLLFDPELHRSVDLNLSVSD